MDSCQPPGSPKFAPELVYQLLMQEIGAGWLKAWAEVVLPAGDIVNEDDVLLQIETDKVTIDVRYTESESGTLTEYLCKEDDTVAVGQEVVKVDKGEHCPRKQMGG